MVRAIAEAQADLVTRKDLDAALSPPKTDLAVLRTEVTQIKWMLGLVIGGIIAVLAKLLSHRGAGQAIPGAPPSSSPARQLSSRP